MDVLLQQNQMVYKFQCQCDTDNIDRIIQRAGSSC